MEKNYSTEDSGIEQTFHQPWTAVETPQNELTQVNRHREIKSLTDSEKISVRKRRLKSLKEAQKMAWEGTPRKMKEFWY